MTAIDQLIAGGVRGLQPYQPGKPVEALERELGITDIIKLASNENPHGYHSQTHPNKKYAL